MVACHTSRHVGEEDEAGIRGTRAVEIPHRELSRLERESSALLLLRDPDPRELPEEDELDEPELEEEDDEEEEDEEELEDEDGLLSPLQDETVGSIIAHPTE
jgi:hypothetical protein|eukprot:m.217454 g.217454  ORF g.217454 m.217454 type:complete len:102 (+) comp25688_c0_seq3:169-474(+)